MTTKLTGSLPATFLHPSGLLVLPHCACVKRPIGLSVFWRRKPEWMWGTLLMERYSSPRLSTAPVPKDGADSADEGHLVIRCGGASVSETHVEAESQVLGALLRQSRRRAGLTQEELAEFAGVSVRSLSDIERGTQQRPHVSTLRRLADALGLSSEERLEFLTAVNRDVPEAADRDGAGERRAPATIGVQPTNLPDQPNHFIGRTGDIDAICRLLHQPSVRLVTLTGPGGVGKTRLALQLGASLLQRFRDGVFLVSLDSVTDPDLVLAAIGRILGLKERDGTLSEDILRNHLFDRHMLLVLDNFEHVIDAAPTIARLLEACPELHILVTSRIPLHVTREHEYPLPPLSVPQPAQLPLDALERYEAVALFVERARSVKPDFAITGDNAAAVCEICHRLDGLPLAIELAAARIKSLPPQLLLDQLNTACGMGPMAMLAGGARDLPVRLQSMRNAIAWSHELLELERQRLFRRLAIFVNGFTLEAADAICRADGEPSVLDGLVDLVDQSLVRSYETGDGGARFMMLETIREYAWELLEESGEAEFVWTQYAAYYRELASTAEAELRGPRQDAWFERLERDHGNLRAVLSGLTRGADGEAAAQLAGALWRFWQVRGYLNEGARWLDHMLQADGVTPLLRAKVLHGRSALAHNLGDYHVSTALATESLELFRQAGDAHGMAHALVNLAYVAIDRGDYEASATQYTEALHLFRGLNDRVSTAQTLNDLGCVRSHQEAFEQARELFTEGLSLSRELGDTRAVGIALLNLADLDVHQGDYERAIELLETSLELRRQLRDEAGISFALGNLGEAMWLHGEHARAASLLLESVAMSDRLGHRRAAAYCLFPLAALTAAEGHMRRSARLWGIAESWCERMDMALPPYVLARYHEPRSSTRAALGEREWSTEWEQGRAMTAEAAIAYVLDSQTEWHRRSDATSGLDEDRRTPSPANIVTIGHVGAVRAPTALYTA